LKINPNEFYIRNLRYIVRSARKEDAETLSEIRLQIDGETENMDRERGEALIDKEGFEKIIKDDTESGNNLFLVAEANGRIVGFSRCEGSNLRRTLHRVEFGVGVLKEFWGYGIGKNLLKESTRWADTNGVRKVSLSVLETNEKAINLYKENGFEIEGILKDDKLLLDGNYYNTILMGRINR
jgi:RimJ/RimL family protein N-acetyltransferase